MSLRVLLIASCIYLQAQLLIANRDDGVAHYYLQKGHKFDQHFDLAVDRVRTNAAACDKSAIFKAIAGGDGKIQESEWTEMFEKMDGKGDEGKKDGKITQAEMIGYFKSLDPSVECTAEEIAFIFEFIDKDKNGTIDLQEWSDAWKALMAADKAENGGNGDGTIDEPEWNKVFSPPTDTDSGKKAPTNTAPKDDSAKTTEKGKNKCDSVAIFNKIAKDKNIKEADWIAVFSDADANNDGSITNAEMVTYFKGKGLDCNEDSVKFLFDKFASDDLISKEKWTKDAWNTLKEQDKPGHTGGDDGMINEEEWKAAFADSGKKDGKESKSGALRCAASILASAAAGVCLSVQVLL